MSRCGSQEPLGRGGSLNLGLPLGDPPLPQALCSPVEQREKETKAQGSILRLEKRGRAWMDAKSSCGPWAWP